MKKLLHLLAAALLAVFALPALAAPAWFNFTVQANGSGVGNLMISESGGYLYWDPA
jgi:hypothetical protein